nr:immunoglobulin heavy chain junction region [Macaca mulatta]MOX58514.1 immunoglobulin heavy chain junction region [Macaca mulatta]MOX58670.1 immunoglobulin heavy chain junction region [Macaca mulatta]MOX58865.1 immunoglobulin heavy chain junction region [Macaca mulatta]MOX59005.1 immunoglobulin heavy chain junction region [Macaca mulatta]
CATGVYYQDEYGYFYVGGDFDYW